MLKFLFGATLLAVGFGGALFVEPVWGVYLFAALSHIRLQQLGENITLPQRIPIVISVLTLILYALSPAYARKFRRWPAEIWLFGLVVIAMALSSARAVFDPAAAWQMTYAYFEYWVFFVLLIQMIDTPRRLDGFHWTLVVSAAWLVFRAWELRGTTGPRFENLGGGNIADCNEYAAALVLLFPFVYQRTLSPRRLIAWPAAALCFGVVMAVVIAASRGGFLGLAVIALLMVACIKGRRARNVAILTLVAAAVLYFANSAQILRLDSILGAASGTARDNSAKLRIEEWRLAWQLFLRHPLLGIGPSNFWYYSGYLLEGQPYGTPGHVTHSLWMELLSSGGLMVTLPYLLLLWRFFRGSWRLARRYAAAGRQEIALYIQTPMLGMAGLLVCATFLDRMVYEPIFWCVALGVTHRYLWGGAREANEGSAARAGRPVRRRVPLPSQRLAPTPAAARLRGGSP
ncbi:MAG: O-antigen ligase family protein [Gammaproteobacteria bacterium]|nr:O-antigen ligase family protein [Gammaproteobacteria bacterium]